jgi:Co/Zn/Cd efflux system component
MGHSCHNHFHSFHVENLSKERRLYTIATIVTSIVLVAQWYFATLFGNIALLGDTIHVGSDLITHLGSLTVVILLSLHFGKFDDKKLRHLFGWFGIALLAFGVIHTGKDILEHFQNPRNTANWVVFSVAVLGGIGNVIVHIMLHRVPANLRTITHEILSAHVFADLLMSTAVAVSVFLRIVYANDWNGFIYTDPVAASIVALYMAYLVIILSYKLTKDE